MEAVFVAVFGEVGEEGGNERGKKEDDQEVGEARGRGERYAENAKGEDETVDDPKVDHGVSPPA